MIKSVSFDITLRKNVLHSFTIMHRQHEGRPTVMTTVFKSPKRTKELFLPRILKTRGNKIRTQNKVEVEPVTNATHKLFS